jgi:predicted MPP superfamily phosphohydrolase
MAALVTLAVGIGDACFVEPYSVETTRHRVTAAVRSPVVLAHLSDLHLHGFGPRERHVVEVLDREHPDVIVVTGDTVDEGTTEPAREFLGHLHAPLGVWVVNGNWENWRKPAHERDTYASLGATLLVNEGRLVRPDIWVAGVDDSMSGHADLGAALRGAPSDAVKLALFHSPEYFDAVAPRIDLAFAGHTHGGQVRLPFFGPPWLPPGSGRFVAGWYSGANARLYVSRGIGMSIASLRFLCRPEIALISIVPAR